MYDLMPRRGSRRTYRTLSEAAYAEETMRLRRHSADTSGGVELV